MAVRLANNFSTTLSSPAGSTENKIELASTEGFPDISNSGDWTPLTIYDYDNTEIVHVTSISGTTLTVNRGQEGTNVNSWSNGAWVDLRDTRESLYALREDAKNYSDDITSNSGNWDTAYDRSVTGVSGDGNSTLTISQQNGSETTDLSHTHPSTDLPSDVAYEETDVTFKKVTTTGNLDVSGDAVIGGNLKVEGETTAVNSNDLQVEDNTITINKGESGDGVSLNQAGIVVDRGTLPDYKIVFDEQYDRFRIGKEGDLQTVTLREENPTDSQVAVWDESKNRIVTTDTIEPQITFKETPDVNGDPVATQSDLDSSTSNSGNWDTAYDRSVTGVKGSGNNTITINRQDGTTVETNLDHTHDVTEISNVYSKIESENKFLEEENNLSDLGSNSKSRSNLDVYSKSETDSAIGTATSDSGDWDTAYERSVTGVSGGGNSEITINQQVGSVSADLSHTHDYSDLPNDVETESGAQSKADSAESSAKSYADTQTSNSGNWDTAYDRSVTSVSGSGGGNLTISKQDNTAISTDLSHTHDYNELPSDVETESGAQSKADSAESSANSYTDTEIGNLSQANWDTAYDRSVTGVSGDGNSTLTINQQTGSETTDLSHTHGKEDIPDSISYVNEENTFTEMQFHNLGMAKSNYITHVTGMDFTGEPKGADPDYFLLFKVKNDKTRKGVIGTVYGSRANFGGSGLVYVSVTQNNFSDGINGNFFSLDSTDSQGISLIKVDYNGDTYVALKHVRGGAESWNENISFTGFYTPDNYEFHVVNKSEEISNETSLIHGVINLSKNVRAGGEFLAKESYVDSKFSELSPSNWDTAYSRSVTSVSGTGNGTITINQQSGNVTANLSHSHGYNDLPSDVETTSGAQNKANSAETDAKSYTDTEINKLPQSDWSSAYSRSVKGVSGSGNGTLTINQQTGDVTADLSHSHGYVDLPSDVETTSGAQNKADRAEIDANNYTDSATSNSGNWNTAYDRSVTGISGNGNGNVSITKQDKTTISASLAHSHGYGDLPNDVETESGAQSKADAAESNSRAYTDNSTSNSGNWDTAYDRSVKGVSGNGNSTLTINQQTGSVTTDLSHTHDGRYLRSDTANNYMDFSNNESSNYNQDGRVWFDSSSGLYTVAQNADHSNPALMWSSANFNAGGGLTVSYDNEDHPTLSLSGDSFDSTGNYGNLRARSTTAGDVGLDNVRNVSSYSQSEADSNFASSGHSHGKGDIPGTVAYEDESNTFSEQQTFNSGTNYGGGFVVEYNSNSKSLDFKLA